MHFSQDACLLPVSPFGEQARSLVLFLPLSFVLPFFFFNGSEMLFPAAAVI